MAKKVLITGSKGALGQAVMARFSKDSGLMVRGVDRDEVNLSDRASLVAFFERVGSDFETVIHCAGGFRFSEMESTSEDDIRFLYEANFESALRLFQQVLPGMKARRKGQILVISSLATQGGAPGVSVYAATKAALNLLVQSTQQEVLDHGISINAVMPSVLDTPANRSAMKGADTSKWVPLETLSDIIYRVTQDWSGVIHGALIPVQGG